MYGEEDESLYESYEEFDDEIQEYLRQDKATKLGRQLDLKALVYRDPIGARILRLSDLVRQEPPHLLEKAPTARIVFEANAHTLHLTVAQGAVEVPGEELFIEWSGGLDFLLPGSA